MLRHSDMALGASVRAGGFAAGRLLPVKEEQAAGRVRRSVPCCHVSSKAGHSAFARVMARLVEKAE
ncbi:MAG: hypothetical protein HZC39_00880 [Chloroflexi bacterium]|nr:hypothetical protein [Chloroflexota bacterium]MBI5702058.1 hypothetical protein [Chloroflexota bacterium]